MQKNDIENNAQEDGVIWMKPVVTRVIISLMEIGVTVVVGLFT